MARPKCKAFVGVGNWAVFLLLLSQHLEGLFASDAGLSTTDPMPVFDLSLEPPQHEGYDDNASLAQTTDVHDASPVANEEEAESPPSASLGVVAEEVNPHEDLAEDMAELTSENSSTMSPRTAARYAGFAVVVVICLAVLASRFRERRAMAEVAADIAKLKELSSDGEQLAQSIGTSVATGLWTDVSDSIAMAEKAQLAMDQELRKFKMPLVSRVPEVQRLRENIQTGIRHAVATLRLLRRRAYDKVSEIVQEVTPIEGIASWGEQAEENLKSLLGDDYASAWVTYINSLDHEVSYSALNAKLAQDRFTSEPQFADVNDRDLLVSARAHLEYVKSVKEARDSAARAALDLKVSTATMVKQLLLRNLENHLGLFQLALDRLQACCSTEKARFSSEKSEAESLQTMGNDRNAGKILYDTLVAHAEQLRHALSIAVVEEIRAEVVETSTKLEALLVESEKRIRTLPNVGEQVLIRDAMSEIATRATMQAQRHNLAIKEFIGRIEQPDTQQFPESRLALGRPFQCTNVLEPLVARVKQAGEEAAAAAATCKSSSREILKGTVENALEIGSKVITQGVAAAKAHYEVAKLGEEYALLNALEAHMAESAAMITQVPLQNLDPSSDEAGEINGMREELTVDQTFVAEAGSLSKIAETAARMRSRAIRSKWQYYKGASQLKDLTRPPAQWTVPKPGVRSDPDDA